MSTHAPRPPQGGRPKPSPATPTEPSPRPLSRATTQQVARAVKRSIARSGMPDLDDLEQTTWVRLLERLEGGHDITSPEAFAKGIASNVIREQKRALVRMRRTGGADLCDVDALCPDDAPLVAEVCAERNKLVALLDAAKQHMSASDRWLIEARFLDDASYAEILPRFWQRFGRPIRTTAGLRTAVFHARAQLVAAIACNEREADKRCR